MSFRSGPMAACTRVVRAESRSSKSSVSSCQRGLFTKLSLSSDLYVQARSDMVLLYSERNLSLKSCSVEKAERDRRGSEGTWIFPR